MEEENYVSPQRALGLGWLLELDVAVQHHGIQPCFWTDDRVAEHDEISGHGHLAPGDSLASPAQRMDNQLDAGLREFSPAATWLGSTTGNLHKVDTVHISDRCSPLVTACKYSDCTVDSGCHPTCLPTKSGKRSQEKRRGVRFSFEVAFWFPAPAQLTLSRPEYPCTGIRTGRVTGLLPSFAAPSSEVEQANRPSPDTWTGLEAGHRHNFAAPSCEVEPVTCPPHSRHPPQDSHITNHWFQGGSCRSLASDFRSCTVTLASCPTEDRHAHIRAPMLFNHEPCNSTLQVSTSPTMHAAPCSRFQGGSCRSLAESLRPLNRQQADKVSDGGGTRPLSGSRKTAASNHCSRPTSPLSVIEGDVNPICTAALFAFQNCSFQERPIVPKSKAHHKGQRPASGAMGSSGGLRPPAPRDMHLIQGTSQQTSVGTGTASERNAADRFTSFDVLQQGVLMDRGAGWDPDRCVREAVMRAVIPNPFGRLLFSQVVDYPGPQVAVQSFGTYRTHRAVVFLFNNGHPRLQVWEYPLGVPLRSFLLSMTTERSHPWQSDFLNMHALSCLVNDRHFNCAQALPADADVVELILIPTAYEPSMQLADTLPISGLPSDDPFSPGETYGIESRPLVAGDARPPVPPVPANRGRRWGNSETGRVHENTIRQQQTMPLCTLLRTALSLSMERVIRSYCSTNSCI